MEHWSYVSEEKGFVSEETISSFNSLARSKKALLGWELKTLTTPCAFGNNMSLENQGFGEYIEMMGKQVPGDSVCGGGRIIDPTTTEIAFSREDDSSSKISSSLLDSSSRDSSLIDLKLGRIGDRRDFHGSSFSKGHLGLSSLESSTPPKRIKLSGVNSHTAFCQVYGCNKDLSSSKEYHKRHRVCDLHSKTAKVIVNGIEQRFCQQCSRFHLLDEFDDGKRSCRKRLAGHNERRRKPQVGVHSGRAGRMFQSFNDSRFHGTTSFVCQDILRSGFLHPEKYGTRDWCRRIKVEDGSDFRPLSNVPVSTNGHFCCSKLLCPHGVGKEFPSFHESGANAATSGIFSNHSGQYPHELGAADSGSRAFFHSTMLGCEELSSFSTASTSIQGFLGTSDSGSGCALSLLSSQSQNSPNYLLGFPMAHPLVKPGSHTCYSMSQVSEKLVGPSSQASTSGVSNKLPSLGMNPVVGPIMMSSGSEGVNSEITNGIFQGSDFLNSKDRLACEDVPTIDLLQLSSQLQRVEDQRQSMQMKPENDAFCCLRIT